MPARAERAGHGAGGGGGGAGFSGTRREGDLDLDERAGLHGDLTLEA